MPLSKLYNTDENAAARCNMALIPDARVYTMLFYKNKCTNFTYLANYHASPGGAGITVSAIPMIIPKYCGASK